MEGAQNLLLTFESEKVGGQHTLAARYRGKGLGDVVDRERRAREAAGCGSQMLLKGEVR